MPKGLLLASGGIDSTVLMYRLHHRIGECVFADCGLDDGDYCWGLVKHHADKLGLPAHRMKVVLPAESLDSRHTAPFKPPARPKDYQWKMAKKGGKALQDYLEKESSWINGRNIIIFTYAAVRAVASGMNRVYVGFQFDKETWADIDSFCCGDTTPGFVETMNDAMWHGVIRPVKFLAPFLSSREDKKAIIRSGLRLGVDFSKTYSCDFFPPCGTCYVCHLLVDLGVEQARP